MYLFEDRSGFKTWWPRDQTGWRWESKTCQPPAAPPFQGGDLDLSHSFYFWDKEVKGILEEDRDASNRSRGERRCSVLDRKMIDVFVLESFVQNGILGFPVLFWFSSLQECCWGWKTQEDTPLNDKWLGHGLLWGGVVAGVQRKSSFCPFALFVLKRQRRYKSETRFVFALAAIIGSPGMVLTKPFNPSIMKRGTFAVVYQKLFRVRQETLATVLG